MEYSFSVYIEVKLSINNLEDEIYDSCYHQCLYLLEALIP